ncbi:MAG: preprotein translocase subunit SecG [Bdellovibrionota bacterium]|nr:MAG: preprotein translocase subunit SecG [Bdellovibrionota bacterium]
MLSCHAVLCLSLIGLVLLQQGKGADLGAALGGSSQSIFGAAGASGLLIKMTTTIAILFMVTSVLLVKLYQTRLNAPSVVVDPLEGSVMQKIGAEAESAASSTEPAAPNAVPAEGLAAPVEAAPADAAAKTE